MGLDYVIQYKKGVKNKIADALFRRAHSSEHGTTLSITEINPK
jgi:hypothetical protein